MGGELQSAARFRGFRWLERALNLEPGELGRGVLLFLYLFCIMCSYVLGKVARDPLFLAHFKAVQLPYADIASAMLVGLVVAVYVRIARRTSVGNLLIGSSLFFASNALAVWLVARWFHFVWLYPVFYIWVGIFGVLGPAQVWTLANYVLTTREARRLFGLVGSGAILGWICAGALSKALIKARGVESLVGAIFVFLLVCGVLVAYIWRTRRQEAPQEAAPGEAPQPRNLWESMRLVWSSKYLLSISAVIWLASTVTMVVNWQFKAISKQHIPDTVQLGLFFSNFTFYAGLLSLVVQLFLTSRLLRRFGIGPALVLVPIALLTGSIWMLLSAGLTAAILLRGSDQVLRYSVDKVGVELLYLPLPSRIKLQVKWFIDTVIWRCGDLASGLMVLVLATYLKMSAARLSWFVALLILGWIAAAWSARRNYVVTLTESIRQHRVELERASTSVLDRTATQVLAAKLAAADTKEVLYALGAFEIERRRTPHPAIRGLLSHPAAEVRRKALTILAAAGDRAILPQVQELLRDPDLDVRTEALLFLCRYEHIDPLAKIEQLGEFADYSIRSGVVAYLAHPGETQELIAAQRILETMVGSESPRMRLEAARLLGRIPDSFDPLLATLLADADPEVVREAIRSVASLRKRRLVPELIDRLADPRVANDATEALAGFGDVVTGTLRDQLADAKVAPEVRRQIPAILAAIASQEAATVLQWQLLESDTALRYQSLVALNRLVHHHPECELDRAMVESLLAAEILGHYRSYQILDALNAAADDNVTRPLADSMAGERERIFRLLSLLYPRHDFESAYYGLQAESAAVHDNALEFMDNVLKPELRRILVPLLDSHVSVAERARLGGRFVRAQFETREQAAAALVCSDDPWLRACGAYVIGSLGLRGLEPELDKCLQDADPLLRQAAGEAKARLAAACAAAGAR
jgi:AAA family ATP:ADP antiporter